MNRVRVILLTQAVGPLDYKLPAGIEAGPGSIVVVPLGPRKITGVVWDETVFPADPVDPKKLRAVYEVLDVPPLSDGLRALINWTADYYITAHANILRMVLSSSAALSGAATITEYRATGLVPQRMTELRAAALDQLEGAQGLVRELASEAGVSDAVIRGLIKAGAFEPVQVGIDTPMPLPDPDFSAPVLTSEQSAAAAAMVEAVKAQQFAPMVLDG